MANQETQILDDIIVKSRRKMLTLGATSLAALMLGTTRQAKAAGAYTDNDILNFALNLEYLEANFYYLSAFGTTIDKPNAASTKAGGPTAGIPITGSVGTAGTVSGGSQVPFATITAASYAIETAIEEGKHVLTLQGALGSMAVAQPAINLGTSWQMLAAAANGLTPAGNIPAAFSPYGSDNVFLVGAYVFEDVGVTAYHGAASLLTGTTTTLPVAAGILAVEAYHAGLIRTTLNNIDSTGSMGLVGYTNSISALRAHLSNVAAGSSTGSSGTYDPTPDDYGLATAQVSLGGGANVTSTHIVDVDLTATDMVNSIAFARTTTQVLNIVTGGGAIGTSGSVVTPAKGVFFPNGMNAGPNGFS